MNLISHVSVLALAAVAAAPIRPAAAQDGPADLRAELLQDIEQLQQKVVSLAVAVPADRYDWSPMEGVRTVGQVYLHVAASNYVFPSLVGVDPPASVSISADAASLQAFEAAGGTKEEIVAKLRDSFQHLIAALERTPELDAPVDLPNLSTSARSVWLATVTHVHEHLGQSIAYARANHIVPPWSR